MNGYLDDFIKKMTIEREYQNKKWGDEFDKLNTPNDWIAFIVSYAGKAVTLPWEKNIFKTMLVKVATLCAAAPRMV